MGEERRRGGMCVSSVRVRKTDGYEFTENAQESVVMIIALKSCKCYTCKRLWLRA